MSGAAGIAAIIGGLLGVALAPLLVIVKYRTGWSIIPEPWWISAATPALGQLLGFSSPVGLWVAYGSLYTVALVLMLVGLAALVGQIRRRGSQPRWLWLLMLGLALVAVVHRVHTATWHEKWRTTPTPGTHPVANTGYAVHMMGMNVVLLASFATGVQALRRRLLPAWLAWLFVLVAPSAVALSLTILPTSPSGGLWMFSVTMIGLGSSLRRSSGSGGRRACPG